MSLNWNTSNVKDFDINFPDWVDENNKPQLNAIVNCVVYYCLFLDMGEITEKNITEFYFRMKVWDKLFGCLANKETEKDIEEFPISYDDIVKLIGLKTNVSTLSRSKFMAKVANSFRLDIEKEISGE